MEELETSTPPADIRVTSCPRAAVTIRRKPLDPRHPARARNTPNAQRPYPSPCRKGQIVWTLLLVALAACYVAMRFELVRPGMAVLTDAIQQREARG